MDRGERQVGDRDRQREPQRGQGRAPGWGGSLFRFTQVEAGQPFRLYDSQGNLLLRDSGAIRFTIVFDALGDATPGGIVVEELEPSVRGPHPGFDDATLCPVLVPLLAGA